MVEPNRERPLCIFCHRFRGRKLGTYANLILEASSDAYFLGILACKCDFYRDRCPYFGKYCVCFSGPIVLMLDVS